MAVDTETKRRSVTGYTGPPVLPVADGTVDPEDKPHVAGLYYDAAGAGGGGYDEWWWLWKRSK